MGFAPSLIALAPGLALGTWLNNAVSRGPARGLEVGLRSNCSTCGSTRSLLDSFAVLSYLSQRRKCRNCGTPRGLRYPALELGSAALSVACFARFGFTGRALVAASFCSILLLLAAYDIEQRIVPNAIVIPAAFLILAADVAVAPGRSREWIAAAIAAGFVFLALGLIYPQGLGMGDVKLAVLLGAGLGTGVFLAVLVAFVATLVPAAYFLAKRGRAGLKTGIPLAPFLGLGAIVALFVT
jgi:leader peptidase (prepilin peptidase)/N-methyltransferase